MELFHWVKNKDGKFISCSENVAKLAGADSPQALIGKSDFDLPWKNRAAIYLEEEVIVLQGGHINHTQSQTTNDGDIQIFVSKSPLYTKEGKIAGTIGSSVDITRNYVLEKTGTFDNKGNLILGEKLSNKYLTPQETRVLKRILYGYTSKQIAKCLTISPRTVEDYIISLKRKLSCKTKNEIIEFSIKNNIAYLVNNSSL